MEKKKVLLLGDSIRQSYCARVKELLAEVDARTLARHVTKVDCLVGAGRTLGQWYTFIL